MFSADEFLEASRSTAQEPGEDVRVADKVVAAVARCYGATDSELVRKRAWVAIPVSGANEDLRLDLLHPNVSPKHLRDPS